MEYLDGETLSVRLRSRGGLLHEREAILISRQLASALAATHARGIIHRDLKPGNISVVEKVASLFPAPSRNRGERPSQRRKSPPSAT